MELTLRPALILGNGGRGPFPPQIPRFQVDYCEEKVLLSCGCAVLQMCLLQMCYIVKIHFCFVQMYDSFDVPCAVFQMCCIAYELY